MKRMFLVSMILAVLGVCGLAFAAEMYTLETPKVSAKAGKKAKATIRIKATEGNHVNDQESAPFSVKLKGEGLTFDKEALGHGDAKFAGGNATIEIPFTAAKAGATKIEAEMKFFVCTPKSCMPQKAHVEIPVTVK